MTKGKPFNLNFRAKREEKFLQLILNLNMKKGPYQMTKRKLLNFYFRAKREEKFMQLKPNLSMPNDKGKTF